MRSFYGGKKNRGARPNAFRKGSGSILRKSLQQLEAAGLIIHDKTGRKVSPAGMSFMDNLSHEVKITPPAPVPKRVAPVTEEPKKVDTKKKAKVAVEGADGAKAEKKAPKAKKAESKK
jgi:small subunit ribosomal protein S19e